MRENIIKRVASIPIVGYILKSISVSRNEDDKNKKPSTKSSNLNCARAACNDISSNFHASMMAIAKADVNNLDPRDSVPTRGPIDRVELGRSTWNLLHTTCANYPSNPSAEEQSQAEKMIMSLARLYPCPHCAKDFRAAVKLNPPRVESRRAFSIWCCERHNEVNEKLHKPLFPCTMEALDRRWGDEPEREEEDDESEDRADS